MHTVKGKPGHASYSQLLLFLQSGTWDTYPPPATPGHHPSATHLFGSCWSCLLAHPVPSLGTITMLGSFPLFSDFRLGRFAGGGIRRAVATFPRLCKPCLGITARKSTRDRTHTSQEERGQFAPLLSLQVRKTKPTKCLAVALGPASSSPDYRDKEPLNCIGSLILPWQEAAGGAHAREESDPGSSVHSDHPCTRRWPGYNPRAPKKAWRVATSLT